jgi:hypothetical protein
MWDPNFSSTYHLVDGPVRVLWNNLKWMESSMMLFEEHHKWNIITWLVRSSLDFPSNFGIFEGSLVGILGHVGSCKMGSFVILVKSGMLRDSKYGIGILVEDYFRPLCEKVVDMSLERYLVGLYFSLQKNFDPRLLVKKN